MSTTNSTLQEVLDYYDKVFEAFQQNQISADEATHRVSQAVVTDSSGTRWGLTAQKVWWKETPQGQRYENADPTEFLSTPQEHLPPPPGGFPNPFQSATQPPSPSTSSLPPPPGDYSPLYGESSGYNNPYDTPTPWNDNQESTEPRFLDDVASPKKKTSKKSTGSLSQYGGGVLQTINGVLERLPFSKRTFVIIVVAAILVIFAFVLRDSSDPAATPTPGTPPATSSQDSGQAAPTDLGTAPTTAQQDEVLEKIKAGNFSSAVVGELGPELSRAAWAGMTPAGLTIDLGAFGEGNTQIWVIKNSEGAEVKSVTVTWDSSPGTWMVTELPNLLQ